MTAIVLLIGVSAVLATAALGVGLFAVWRTQALMDLTDRGSRTRTDELRSTFAALQKAFDRQAAQLQDLQLQPVSASVPAMPRAGLNLVKRSQVLRMHRSGDAPDRIAAALEVPLQEVNLLIKVHRIVISQL